MDFLKDLGRAASDVGRVFRSGRRAADDFGRAVNVDPSKRDSDRARNEAREQRELYNRDGYAVRRGGLAEQVDRGRAPSPYYNDDHIQPGRSGGYNPRDYAATGRDFDRDLDRARGAEPRGGYSPTPQAPAGDIQWDEPQRQPSRSSRPEPAPRRQAPSRNDGTINTPIQGLAGRLHAERDNIVLDERGYGYRSEAVQKLNQFLREDLKYSQSDGTDYVNSRNDGALDRFRQEHGNPRDVGNPQITNDDLRAVQKFENIQRDQYRERQPARAPEPRGQTSADRAVEISPLPAPGAPTPLTPPRSPAADRAPSAPARAPATPAAPASKEGWMARGSNGDNVKELQTVLQKQGFDLGEAGVDGKFGPKTEAAVRAFQEKQGLGVDGVVGTKTLEAVKKAKQQAAAAPTTPAAGAAATADTPTPPATTAEVVIPAPDTPAPPVTTEEILRVPQVAETPAPPAAAEEVVRLPQVADTPAPSATTAEVVLPVADTPAPPVTAEEILRAEANQSLDQILARVREGNGGREPTREEAIKAVSEIGDKTSPGNHLVLQQAVKDKYPVTFTEPAAQQNNGWPPHTTATVDEALKGIDLSSLTSGALKNVDSDGPQSAAITGNAIEQSRNTGIA